MASFLISGSASLTLTHTIPARAFFRPPLVPNPLAIRFPGDLTRRRPRGLTVVTRAGPSTNSILFAIAIPLSLLTITFFASIKIADKLDRDYFEEVSEFLWNGFFFFWSFIVFGWLRTLLGHVGLKGLVGITWDLCMHVWCSMKFPSGVLTVWARHCFPIKH